MDLEKYRQIFLRESDKYLQEIGSILIDVEAAPEETGHWQELHGKIHSIKGMARAMSLDAISRLAHEMEAWCLKFQRRECTAQEASIRVLTEGYSLLKALVPRLGQLDVPELNTAYYRLLQVLAKGPEAGGTVAEPKPPLQDATSEAVTVDPIRSIGVPCSLIEELLGFSQELLLMERSKPALPPEMAAVQSWIDQFAALGKGLYFRLAQLRLMSIEEFIELYRHTIHHQARQMGKTVRIVLSGGDIKADVALLDRLREPMIHIVRNAIAHGIEPPEERRAKGKPEQGTIRIGAESRKETLVLRIADDGAGIRREAIERYLRERRGYGDADIAWMDKSSFFATILNSDFSTASAADETAGRGIGMNVIAQAITYLNGTLDIDSTPGEGTTITVSLPMSLSVMHAVVFTVGPYRIAVPTSGLDAATYGVPPDDLRESILDLRKLFGVKIDERRPPGVLMLRSPGAASSDRLPIRGLMVDSIVGNKPVMILRPGQLIRNARIFSGIGVLESGVLTSMLDVDMLAKNGLQTMGTAKGT